ncbi:hypothetical protein V6Z11_A04G128600 [Gossypium hirsutum]
MARNQTESWESAIIGLAFDLEATREYSSGTSPKWLAYHQPELSISNNSNNLHHGIMLKTRGTLHFPSQHEPWSHHFCLERNAQSHCCVKQTCCLTPSYHHLFNSISVKKSIYDCYICT